MARQVPSFIREKLYTRMSVDPEVTANLRSFLDIPRAAGYTLRGSNEVGFYIHEHNSRTTNIRNIPGLKRIFAQHLSSQNKKPENYNFEQVHTLDNRISINGRWWKTGTECTYSALTQNRIKTHIGRITSYAIVHYQLTKKARGRGKVVTRTTVYAMIDSYTPVPKIIDGVYECPMYPRTSPAIVHVDSLTIYLTRADARKRVRGSDNPRVMSTYNLVPVASAYVL